VTDLFLSYKAEDRPCVALLAQALETDGLSVWWDAHIGGGEDWRDTILRHLEAARAVIVVWSERSVGPHGHFVRDEATRALKRGTYFPVRIDKVDPPLGFGETHALDLSGWKGDRSDPRYQAVISALRKRLGITAEPTKFEQPKRFEVNRRAVVIGGSAAAVAAAGAGAWFIIKPDAAESNSIAVLPFANLSGDSKQAYFSDGIAEVLRSVLSRIPDLTVVARTSSEAVRNADAHTAASKLHVSNILTGSVRRSGAMIRISAQLVDGANGLERWSEVYDRPAGDSLQIQSEIANRVAQALSIQLGANERRALKEGGTANSEAQDLLLQAKAIVWRSDDEESLRHAIELVDRASALDPNYADALTAKASILGYFSGYLGTSAADSQANSKAAEKLARDAIRIAPRSAQAHAALANILWINLRLSAGLAEFAKVDGLRGAISTYSSGLDPYSLALAQSRRFDASRARADRLIASDPLNPNAFTTKGMSLSAAGRYADAEPVLRQAIALGPELTWPRAVHAYLLMQLGRLEESEKEFDSLGGTGPWLAWAAVLAERRGNRAKADRLVSVMQKSMGDGAYYQYAQVYAQQERTNEAIAALEKGWTKLDAGLTFLQVDPMLDPLRKDARFQALVDRLDFPT
jgi:serine/threonine-protein kinase